MLKKNKTVKSDTVTIIDYMTVTLKQTTDEDFSLKVRGFISEGWQPLGGNSLVKVGSNIHLSQAMVKYG
jgi:hypothetical protein